MAHPPSAYARHHGHGHGGDEREPDDGHDRLDRGRRPLARVLHRGEVAEQSRQGERGGDEVPEPGAIEQVDRAHPEVGGHPEGTEEIPAAIERLVPAERAPEELGPGADPVPQQADRPDQLVRLPAPEPLVADHDGEHERQRRARQRQQNVEIHGPDRTSPMREGRATEGLEPTSGFEPETSSLPRTCSAN